ncbi:MAG: hypothetical protein M5U26_15105 [Planctomycetota bacterium]|nr:hypothetical protein [Planctomycetota bacterium]
MAVFEAADNVKFFARDMKDDSGSAAPVRILVSKTIEMLGDGLDPIDGMGMGMGLWERKLDEALPPNATPGTRVIIRRFQGEAGAQAAPEAHKPAAPPPQPEKKE